jgi:signal transduction histidine kinase
MRERGEHLGGTFTLTSAPGAGSRIEVAIPLPARDTRVES